VLGHYLRRDSVAYLVPIGLGLQLGSNKQLCFACEVFFFIYHVLQIDFISYVSIIYCNIDAN
jgi:hypothetical protein